VPELNHKLFLEEILEGLAGIISTRWRSRCSGSHLSGLGVGSGSGVFFDGHAKLVKLAVVLCVLGSDALGDGLRALELCAGIEETTLLATVELKLALGTLAVGVEARGEDSAAVGTAAACNGADHAWRAGPKLIGAWTALRRFAVVLFFFVAFFRVAVAAMTVLSIHKRLRPDAMPDCDYDCLDFRADAHFDLGMYQTGLLHSAHSAIVTQRIRTGLATSKQEMLHLCF